MENLVSEVSFWDIAITWFPLYTFLWVVVVQLVTFLCITFGSWKIRWLIIVPAIAYVTNVSYIGMRNVSLLIDATPSEHSMLVTLGILFGPMVVIGGVFFIWIGDKVFREWIER